MKVLRRSIVASLFLISILAIQSCSQTTEKQAELKEGQIEIKADVWADNWFSFYLGEKLIKEDSVSITTERSFNSETFTFIGEYPLTLNFVVKDFIQNDTGLEYIGTRRQQMGDGGLIAQFTNVRTGAMIAVTGSDWKCQVIHEAPLSDDCEKENNPTAGEKPCEFKSLEEPGNWKSPDFDDSKWNAATLYTAQDVSPKGGYDGITWNPSAKFIWGPNLKTNNTLLCRLTVAESK